MQVVCEASQCGDALVSILLSGFLSDNDLTWFVQVKVAALQCLVRIMSLYYQFMESYMSAALFPVSTIYFVRIYTNNLFFFKF